MIKRVGGAIALDEEQGWAVRGEGGLLPLLLKLRFVDLSAEPAHPPLY